MECLLQFLDDLDDFVYAVALTGERIREFCHLLVSVFLALVVLALEIVAIAQNPALAVTVASLLGVVLLCLGAIRQNAAPRRAI